MEVEMAAKAAGKKGAVRRASRKAAAVAKGPRRRAASAAGSAKSAMNTGASSTVRNREPRWYSIAEAAEYLGVSEPTIYRWMKEGLLSFFKVGGSTRFAREGLDAVIEKTTGLKEAEAAAGRCVRCGHGVLVEGKLQTTGRLYFKPAKTKFWVFAESLVGLRAKVCAACGFVQMHADVSKLKKLRPGTLSGPGRSPT